MDEPPIRSEAEGSSLPLGWAVVRVDEAGAVRLGRQRSPDQHSGTHPTKYIRAANIKPTGIDLSDLLEMNFTPAERETFGLQVGDVLLTEASGSPSQVGRAAIWHGAVEPCCYQNTVIRFRPHLTTPEYAIIVFKHFAATGALARVARGVGIQHLGASRFAELAFPLPPLGEQRRIAEAAGLRHSEFEEAAFRLRSALNHLQTQVREILAAAVTGDLISQEQAWGAKESLVVGAAVARQAPLDERRQWSGDLIDFDWTLPSGWEWRRIDEVGSATLGRQRSPQHERGQYMRPYLRVANVLEDHIDFGDLKQMNFSPEEQNTYLLQAGDIILNEGQSPELVGRPALYKGEVKDLYFQNHLIRFRAKNILNPEFALLVFRHYMHTGVFRQIARWSTNIANMGIARFKSLPFPLPSLEEQNRIVSEARRLLDATTAQISAVRAALDRLPEFEQELLAAAVAGELVPQDPDDEPASALFRRLGPPNRGADTASKLGRKVDRMANKGARPMKQDEPKPDLAAVLRENGGVLSLPELFARGGYDRNLPEHVELFYLALRDALGRTIRLSGDADENAELEADDAA